MQERSKINWNAIWGNLALFTGLPFRFHKGKYYAKCYADGTAHKRRDKTVATFKKGKIMIIEQGGFYDDLITWMKTYGSYANDREIFKALEEESGNGIVAPEYTPPPRIYVYRKFMNHTLGLYSDSLYRFLCTLFPEDRVRKVFDLYHVGSSGDNNDVVYWFVNEKNQICHDKRIAYKNDGHRDKDEWPYRFFKQDKGFTGLTYFGMHLVPNYEGEIYLVESEKTALLFYLMYGKLCLATGGSNCLLQTDRKFILLPDYDKAGKQWITKGGIEWWNSYENIQIGEDIGDTIIRERIKNLHSK
jgi:hypothetical protein